MTLCQWVPGTAEHVLVMPFKYSCSQSNCFPISQLSWQIILWATLGWPLVWTLTNVKMTSWMPLGIFHLLCQRYCQTLSSSRYYCSKRKQQVQTVHSHPLQSSFPASDPNTVNLSRRDFLKIPSSFEVHLPVTQERTFSNAEQNSIPCFIQPQHFSTILKSV